MDLKDLELLVALAEHRHFARAAKAAHLSQPAFSSRLRRLEEALRLPLVNRGGRFSGFTAEGEVVLAGARRLLADWRATVASVGAKRGSLTGRLALGVVPSALEAVGPLLAPFRARHPAVHVTVASLTSDRIRQGLDEFSLDLGLTYAEGDPGLIERPLYAEGYALIGRPALLAGLAAPVAWEDAAGLPISA